MSRKFVTHRGKTRYKYTPVVPQSRSRLSRLRLGTPRRLPFRESPRPSRGRARGRVSVSRSFIYIYTEREKTSAHRGGFHACFSVQIGSTFDTFYGTNLHTLERRLIVSDTHTRNAQALPVGARHEHILHDLPKARSEKRLLTRRPRHNAPIHPRVARRFVQPLRGGSRRLRDRLQEIC